MVVPIMKALHNGYILFEQNAVEVTEWIILKIAFTNMRYLIEGKAFRLN